MGTMTALQVLVFSALFLDHPAPDEVEWARGANTRWPAKTLNIAAREVVNHHKEELRRQWQEGLWLRGPVEGRIYCFHYDQELGTVQIYDCQLWLKSPTCWRMDFTPGLRTGVLNDGSGREFSIAESSSATVVQQGELQRSIAAKGSGESETKRLPIEPLKMLLADSRVQRPGFLSQPHLSLPAGATLKSGPLPCGRGDRRHVVLDCCDISDATRGVRIEIIIDEEATVPVAVKVTDRSSCETVFVINEWAHPENIPDEIFEIRELPPDPANR